MGGRITKNVWKFEKKKKNLHAEIGLPKDKLRDIFIIRKIKIDALLGKVK